MTSFSYKKIKHFYLYTFWPLHTTDCLTLTQGISEFSEFVLVVLHRLGQVHHKVQVHGVVLCLLEVHLHLIGRICKKSCGLILTTTITDH